MSAEQFGPLHGVRIVETAHKAEMCGRYLSDLGATVIKVEPRHGSVSRREGVLHEGRSLTFAVHNANKLGIALDLENPEDLSLFWQMLDSCQLWIESGRPRDSEWTGPSVAQVRQRCPGLVVLSITDFGHVGPYRNIVASPWVLTALCGFLSRSGIGERPPLMPPAALPAAAAAFQAAWAAVVGLWHATETGVGDHIDLSLLEAASQIVDPPMGMAGTASAGGGDRTSRARPTIQPYPTYRCADGYVRIALLSVRQWHAMREWLSNPPDLMGEDLDTIPGRAAAAQTISDHVSELFRTKRLTEVVGEAQTRGIPCAPVLSPSEVLVAEHYLGRGALAPAEVLPGQIAVVPTGLVSYEGRRLGLRTRAPLVGEHDSEIRAELPAQEQSRSHSCQREPNEPPAPNRPLAGIRVLDLGVIVYGAEVGRLFADLGADVIKVENSQYPDGSRVSWGRRMSRTFVAGHRGKRSLGLNLRSDEGKSLFLRLVEKSDLILSNFKPGTLESLGLDYSTLTKANPRVVVVSSSAMGSSGPWSTWLGYGPLVRCATGLTSLWRYPDDPRSFADLTTVYPDHCAARIMATAGLAALIARKRTGRGAKIEGAQSEAILMQLSDVLALESLSPGAVGPQGNTSREGVPWGVYQCAGDDEWCTITVQDDAQWRHLCKAAGFSDLENDQGLATLSGRLGRRAEVEERVRSWVREKDPAQVEKELQSANVPAGAMLRVPEYPDAPYLAARRHLIDVVQPEVGTFAVENAPFWSEHVATPAPAPAPKLAEHTREIMSDLLGLDGAEVDRLAHEGVLEDPPQTSAT